MAKMQPFWWFIAPEVITYWEDRCEVYPNDWVCASPAVPCPWSLDGVPAEGSHCFKGYTTWWGVLTTLHKPITPISLPSLFNFRFWLKAISIPGQGLFMLRLTENYIGVNVYGVGDASVTVRIWNMGYSSAELYSMTTNVWHLIRCEVEQDGSYVRVKLYIDGVYKGIMSKAWTFGDLNEVRLQDDSGRFEVYVDHFRVTNL